MFEMSDFAWHIIPIIPLAAIKAIKNHHGKISESVLHIFSSPCKIADVDVTWLVIL